MNLSDYKEEKPHRVKRIVWHIINHTIFRWLYSPALKGARHSLLRMFGAKIDKKALIYHSVDIYMPWNLVVGRACIGPDTVLYNKAQITIGDDCVISQGSFLCTASHDISSIMLPLVISPITIKDKAWVASGVYVGPGVTIHDAAVCAARSVVVKDVPAYTVVGGNPAKEIKKRELILEL